MIALAENRAEPIPLARACEALAIHRSTFYARRRQGAEDRPARTSRKCVRQPRALTGEERHTVRETLNRDEFCNQPPVEVYQRLLERGIHRCSVSTMHRILREHGENGERATSERQGIMRYLDSSPRRPTRCGPGTARSWRLEHVGCT